MDERVSVRLSDADLALLLQFKKETGLSFSLIARRALYCFIQDRSKKTRLRNIAKKLNSFLEAELMRKLSRYTIRRETLLTRQENILKTLRKSGMPARKITKIKRQLDAEARAYGLKAKKIKSGRLRVWMRK